MLTADGVGEWATMGYGRGEGDEVELFATVDFPLLVGALLLDDHLVPRLPGELGGVQGDGAGAVRGAPIRGTAAAGAAQRGRAGVRARPALLRLRAWRADVLRRPGGAAGHAAAAAGPGVGRRPCRPRGQRPAGARGGAAGQGAVAGRRGGLGEPLPGGWRGAQLRGERAAAARGTVREAVRAAGAGGRGRGAGGGAAGAPAADRTAAGERRAGFTADRRSAGAVVERRGGGGAAGRHAGWSTTTTAAARTSCWRRRRGGWRTGRWWAGSTAAPELGPRALGGR